ncbi:unnamed protein product [Ophioblennius macclurei]
MSRISSVAMEKLLPILTALFSLHPVHSHRGSHGLLCTNDFQSTVTCLWNGSMVDPGVECLISGVKEVFVGRNLQTTSESCQLKHHENSLPGCSFTYPHHEFSMWEKMPSLSMECNGTLVETIRDFEPNSNIKMLPLSAPRVSSTGNATWISWSLGPGVSSYLTNSGITFQVQLKKKGQRWEDAQVLHSDQQEGRIFVEELKGHVELRMRAKPLRRPYAQWSEWSPATSWMGPSDEVEPPHNEEWWLRHRAVLSVVLLLPLCLIMSALLAIYRRCKTRGLLKEKPIPNPSEYFCTLHSVHRGNLKAWLNPLSDSDSFFTSQPCDHISPVLLCENWDAVPSTPLSSSSTSATVHFQDRPTKGSQTSEVADSSSSSSCFSNIGYFMSSSSGGSAHTNSNLAYFAYQDDSYTLQPFLFPTWRAYESLKKEPHSPDSGFCIGKEDELDIDFDREEELDDLSSHLLKFPLRFPFQICPMPSPQSPPHPVSFVQVSSDVRPEDDPAAGSSGGGGGDGGSGPVVGLLPSAMCRSSSMPVEPLNSGYMTLKELHTTFSNNSI